MAGELFKTVRETVKAALKNDEIPYDVLIQQAKKQGGELKKWAEEFEYRESIMKNDICDYVDNNVLNSLIYKRLLSLQLPKPFETTALTVFNEAYFLCGIFEKSKKPECEVDDYYERILFYLGGSSNNAPGRHLVSQTEAENLCYSSIMQQLIINCVYVILHFSKSQNDHMVYCLERIKSKISPTIFKDFESLLNNEMDTIKLQEDEKKTLSFIYTKIATESYKITDFMNSLKKFEFISPDTSLTDFKCVFSGKEVKNPIKWTTHLGGLLDLFRQLNKNKHIKHEGNNMYKIVCACFVDKDGNPFKETDFKNGKIANTITDKITIAVDLLK